MAEDQVSHIRIERTDHRLEIYLGHEPENRLIPDMMNHMADELEAVKGDDNLKLIVFRSSLDRIFSLGMDLEQLTSEHVGGFMASFGHLLYTLNEQSAITVACVDGACMGSALELAVYCDMAIASSRSNLGHPGIKAGIFPPVAAAVYPHLVGRNRAIEILVTGRELSAEEAREMGLLNRVWPAGEFYDHSEAFFRSIERYSAVALRLTKKAIEQAIYKRVPVALRAAEDIYLNELMKTHDANEGVRAMLEGRDPEWRND
ncbi:hypothetical protein GF324_08215 [bacterium]|nr:hypothetical protein [bacterium]